MTERFHSLSKRICGPWLLLAAFLLLAWSTPLPRAAAQETPVGVVELFTSQGCSRCPPADAILAELAQQDDVVALSYHVDYWDYLGWEDAFATPENTARQRAYETVFDTAVFTPQAIINGRHSEVGSNRAALLAALEADKPLPVAIELLFTDQSMMVDVGDSVAGSRSDAHIVLVYYRPQQTVDIPKGENAGREIVYRNIVTSFQTIGMWHGEPMRLELPTSEIAKKGGGCAVLLQTVDAQGNPGPILGAATWEAGAS